VAAGRPSPLDRIPRRMRPISLTSFTTFVALALALTLSACGNKEERIHLAETEGIYVNVDDLKYQVQISRQLNPGAIPEDRTFISGIDPAEAELGPDEVWFAVFVRVENESDSEQVPTTAFELEDQQGNVYEPVRIDEVNPFHYDTSPIRAHGFAPGPDTIARQVGSVGGMLQLFKVSYETLDNRPVELKIRSISSDDEAIVDIDV
jgi:hypothetical protein